MRASSSGDLPDARGGEQDEKGRSKKRCALPRSLSLLVCKLLVCKQVLPSWHVLMSSLALISCLRV